MIRSANTPVFRLHRRLLRDRFAHFRQHGEVYYPVKANPHPVLLGELDRLGSSFGVEGLADVLRLIDLGVDPARILLAAALKPLDELRKARKVGVETFVIDSASDYSHVASLSPATCILRLALHDLTAPVSPRHLKWGMRVEEALDIITRNIDHHIRLGISFYLPKSLYSRERFREAIDTIESRFAGSSIALLDVGGGLDDSSSPDFGSVLKRIREALSLQTLIVEPGRNLLDPSIDLVASVLDVRERFGEIWAYLNVGIYQGLLDAVLIHKRFPIAALSENREGGQATRYRYVLAGPSADTVDYLGEYSFPLALLPGDQVVVRECGAYTWSLRTAFGELDPPGFEVYDD